MTATAFDNPNQTINGFLQAFSENPFSSEPPKFLVTPMHPAGIATTLNHDTTPPKADTP